MGRGIPKIKLVIPSDPKIIRAVRACIGELASGMGFSSEQVHDINLAVNEICANVIKHAYGWNSKGKIIIKLQGDGNKLRISIRDYAPKQDPKQFRSRDLNQLDSHGLGLFLVEQLVDKLQFNTKHRVGNECIIEKYIRPNTSRKTMEDTHELRG